MFEDYFHFKDTEILFSGIDSMPKDCEFSIEYWKLNWSIEWISHFEVGSILAKDLIRRSLVRRVQTKILFWSSDLIKAICNIFKLNFLPSNSIPKHYYLISVFYINLYFGPFLMRPLSP